MILRNWFPFYPADWKLDDEVRDMSLAAKGAYIELLGHQWRKGSVPDDRVKMAKACDCTPEEFDEVWPELECKFPLQPDGTRLNLRLSREWEQAQENSRKASESAKRKWAKRGDATAMRPHSEGIADPVTDSPRAGRSVGMSVDSDLDSSGSDAPEKPVSAQECADALGIAMPDAMSATEMRDNVNGYSAKTSKPPRAVLATGVQILREQAGSWNIRGNALLTPALFNRHWDAIQAAMAGKAISPQPRAPPRPESNPDRRERRNAADVVRAAMKGSAE